MEAINDTLNFNSNDLSSVSEFHLKNRDRMRMAFQDAGKELNDNITKDELLTFLDKHSKKGQFNRKLVEKIFNALSTNGSGQIKVDDFITNFLTSIVEIKKAQVVYEQKLKQEIETKKKLDEQCLKNKNELLNDEEMSPNSYLKITFDRIEFREIDEVEDKSFILTLESTIEGKMFKTDIFNADNDLLEQEFKL